MESKKDRKKHLPKAIVICGPTAAGKTEWSIKLAQKFHGEIVSADSRQVYKKMDIGTAKSRGEWQWQASWKGLRHSYYIEGIPHHLIDFLDPGKRFTVAEFRDLGMKYLKLAQRNGRLPIVAGGTGLYIGALVDNLQIPRVAPNQKLRRSLEEKTPEQLMQLLSSLDAETAETIDQKNKRRIIRALEVCILSGEPFSQQKKQGEQVYDFLQIGVAIDKELLYERIDLRVDKMVERGLVQEIESLLKQKYSWDLPSMSGIGYRQFKDYFDGNATLEESVEGLKRDTKRYARRQMTWFKRDKRIVWCDSYEQAEEKVAAFLGDGAL